MLLEALIYFSNYESIVQINVDLKILSIGVNYCNDMLFHFLDNNLHLNICKSWVKYVDNKSLLTPYLVNYSRDSESLKLLLTFYPDVDYAHDDHQQLFPLCCKYGHLEVVKWLVKNGADIKVNNYKPFQYACQYGHLETAEYLLSLIDSDEEKKQCIQSDENSALTWSAINNHLELAKWLVKNGADMRVNDYQPFQYACEYGHLETAKYLLGLIDTDEEKKQCIHSYNDYALVYSATSGHLEVVKWLISNGANVRVDHHGLFRCACAYGDLETAKYLLALIDTDDDERKLCVQSYNNYALIWSAKRGHIEIVKWLIDNGADHYEAFRYACIRGCLETAKYLLSLMDTDEQKKLCVQSNDNHALRWSANNGDFEIVEWLINNGADVRSNNYEAIRFSYGRKVRNYLLDQLSEEEIDDLN